MDLSICFATLNRVQYLRACLDSIYHSVGDLEWELIIADGGSTDGTLELLREERKRTNLTLIEIGKPTGCIHAFNACFEKAVGTYVANLNDDCIVTGNALLHAVEVIEHSESVGQIAIAYGLPYAKPEIQLMKLGGRKVPYANFGITPKCLGDEVGWWGGPEVGLFRYAGDNYLSAQVWAVGCKVEPLPTYLGYIIHYAAEDATRINSPNDTTIFYSFFKDFKW